MSRPLTLSALVRDMARSRPDHPYLHFEGTTYTYGDLDARSSEIAAALAADGVRPGDRVAVLDKNTPQCLEVMFAAGKCGAVYVPVNWRLAAGEVTAILEDADPRVFITGAEFAEPLATAMADPDLYEPTAVRLLVDGVAHGPFDAFAAWHAGHAAVDPGFEPADDDVALQLYTSGTTGVPKGVMLTGENLLGRHDESARLWDTTRTASTSWCRRVPRRRHRTLLLAMVTGSSSVMLRIADPAAILSAIDEYGVTNGLLVPAIIAALLQTPGCKTTNWSSLRTLMYGARRSPTRFCAGRWR